MAYTKLHQSILASTVWLEPHATRIVWITLLALANKHGEISGTVPGIAHQARVTIGECRAALGTFMAPDPDSRTPDDEGRRLGRIDGGWQILNYEKYRLEASKNDERSKTAERVRRFRERQRNATKALHEIGGNGTVTVGVDIAEAEADSSSGRDSESLDHKSRSNRAREKTARPSRVTPGEFSNGTGAPRQQPIPPEWLPTADARTKLKKTLPWMTGRIAELRLIEFHAWAAGKLFPPHQLDAVWLGFMVKTDRTRFADEEPSQGFNG